MSNDNYTGYRYAMDMSSTRQFIIPYRHGSPVAPIQVVAQLDKDKRLFMNQPILALDDEITLLEPVGKSFSIGTYAYQITQKPSGKIGFMSAPIEFTITQEASPENSNAMLMKVRLTSESLFKLHSMGFDPQLMAQMNYDMEIPHDLADEKIMPRFLRGMNPLLPQHLGGEDGAYLARAHVDESRALENPFLPAPYKDPQEKNTMKNQYNTSSRPRYDIPDEQLESLFKRYGRDYTQLARDGKLDPVIGRAQETDQALKTLTQRKQASLCFTGDAGVGKSAMFAAIAHRLASDNDLPPSLQNGRVIELDFQAMLAGTKYRGEFEARLEPILKGLIEREGIFKGQKVILAIDEIHSQLGAGGGTSGGSDVGNLMKPFLVSKGISVMGTTTSEEYSRIIEKDGALSRRFKKHHLNPPNEAGTLEIIKGLWPLLKKHHQLTEDLSEQDLSYIVTMTTRYAPQIAQPSKSEEAMDMAGASAVFEGRTAITRKDIIAAVSKMSNLSVDFLSQNDNERFLKLEDALPKEVLGQPNLHRITDGLIGARSGLTDEKQPLGCFVLQGPTGTGKTETAKALARYLFGTEDALIKLDMSEYSEKFTVARLIGAPPGYVGFEDAQPALTEKVRQRPYCVLLLDEIEKAHPDVFNTLLSILNDGKMTDNHGKTVLFNNVLILMTTNAGAADVAHQLERGGNTFFGSNKSAKVLEEKNLEDIYKKNRSVKNGGPFRPEMINRIEEIGGFVTYLPLGSEVVAQLALREIEKTDQRLSNPAGANMVDAKLVVSNEVLMQLAIEGYNPAMGARPLRKVVREKIANPLGKWKMKNEEMLRAFIAENGGVVIKINKIGDEFSPVLEKPAVNDNKKKPVLTSNSKKLGGPKSPS